MRLNSPCILTMSAKDGLLPTIKIPIGSLNGHSSRRILEPSRPLLSGVFLELKSRHPLSITSPHSSVVGKRTHSPCCITWPRGEPLQHPGKVCRASWRQLESKSCLRLPSPFLWGQSSIPSPGGV